MAKKTNSKKKKVQQTFGIDDMVNAVHEAIINDPETPASAKEITKKAVKAVLQMEQAIIIGAVADGDKVAYIGFGSFDKRERQARKGRNPQTGKELEIPATVVPGFKPGKEFKDVVKGE